jgi:type IV pilus assembly protein PilB
MSQDARADEERNTQRRAALIGVGYVDTSKLQKQLYGGILPVPELYQLKVVPLTADEHHIHFGITTTTAQQTLSGLRKRFTDQLLNFSIISDTGYREYMRLYDPPKQVSYRDIDFGAKAASTPDMVQAVSATLDQVRPDDMLAYLVQQAYKLKASDIHIENQRDNVRVRFRVDGVLHTVAFISHDKYQHLVYRERRERLYQRRQRPGGAYQPRVQDGNRRSRNYKPARRDSTGCLRDGCRDAPVQPKARVI